MSYLRVILACLKNVVLTISAGNILYDVAIATKRHIYVYRLGEHINFNMIRVFSYYDMFIQKSLIVRK